MPKSADRIDGDSLRIVVGDSLETFINQYFDTLFDYSYSNIWWHLDIIAVNMEGCCIGSFNKDIFGTDCLHEDVFVYLFNKE